MLRIADINIDANITVDAATIGMHITSNMNYVTIFCTDILFSDVQLSWFL